VAHAESTQLTADTMIANVRKRFMIHSVLVSAHWNFGALKFPRTFALGPKDWTGTKPSSTTSPPAMLSKCL